MRRARQPSPHRMRFRHFTVSDWRRTCRIQPDSNCDALVTNARSCRRSGGARGRAGRRGLHKVENDDATVTLRSIPLRDGDRYLGALVLSVT